MDKAIKSNPPPTSGQSGASLSVDFTGQTIDDYRILRRLGRGGMGEVFLAEQLSLKRKVALKILKADVSANPTALQRFKAEAEVVARATHANIVQVYNIGKFQGLHYMALEYVEGRNLREFITKKGPPDIGLALSIMRQVAAALQRASELGIIHRDVKPENILLTRKGEVKVADFGLARSLIGDQIGLNLTQSGVVMGTPLYMSPEQVEGKTVDARTDIYSFGVTCYHMMAGQPPFQGEGAFAVALKHVQEEPRPLAAIRPDLPQVFCAVIHKMMEKNPDQRYQTGRELLKDLNRVRENLGGTSAVTARSISVELVPVPTEEMEPPNSKAGLAATSQQATAPRLLPETKTGRRTGCMWLLAGVTIPLALTAGLALAGLHALAAKANVFAGPVTRPSPGPPPTKPSDDQELEAIIFTQSPQKRERALKDAIDVFLTQRPQVALALCVDLAVLYFEQDRLDDAEKFFTRLESVRKDGHGIPAYSMLIRFGRAIVSALRSKPMESNKLFAEIATHPSFKEFPIKPGVQTGRPELTIWANAGFRFWVAQALYYNDRNGLPAKDVPKFFQEFRASLPKS